ncbi:unnamed protein product [Hermetia illucens]|uniref:Uncharacterized protein n=1 Tax=Hermetia illucens TaxID=343691 RepID=A0A7R8V381_HERIL|nr:unnamed protein product [Hermetia illucens]
MHAAIPDIPVFMAVLNQRRTTKRLRELTGNIIFLILHNGINFHVITGNSTTIWCFILRTMALSHGNIYFNYKGGDNFRKSSRSSSTILSTTYATGGYKRSFQDLRNLQFLERKRPLLSLNPPP